MVEEEEYFRFIMADFDPRKDSGMIWQLRYARLFNRVYDNRKMLAATGLKNEDFLTLREGLTRELPSLLN